MAKKIIKKSDKAEVVITKKDNVAFVAIKMNKNLERYIEYLLRIRKPLVN